MALNTMVRRIKYGSVYTLTWKKTNVLELPRYSLNYKKKDISLDRYSPTILLLASVTSMQMFEICKIIGCKIHI